MAKKISDNPSFQKLRKEMETMVGLGGLVKLLDMSELNAGEWGKIFDKIPEFQKHLEILATIPEEFNKFYSERGWASYESMKFEVMQDAVHLAKDGRIDDGENLLIDYYDQTLKWKINFISGVPEFKPRMRLIELALEDFYQHRYHSTIPILLMMIDGIVNDITKDLGLFAEKVDTSAWDSIAAHDSGLGELSRLLGRTRKKTNLESIDVPYRHGIMHGKELAYDNKLVAVKTWALLFVVRDWIIARKKTSHSGAKPERTIEESFEALRQIQQTKDLIENWQAREINVGTNVPCKGGQDEYSTNSPEQFTIKFISYWMKKNYGKMAEMIVRSNSLRDTDKKLAGQLREAFEGIELIDYTLIQIQDIAPVVTEVTANVTMKLTSKIESKNLTFRWIYMGQDDILIVRGQEGGQWFLIDNFRLEVSLMRL